MKGKEELIHEKFQDIGLSSRLDTRNRITLSQALAALGILKNNKIDEFEILLGSTGNILLRPRTSIPSIELWIHQNPKAMKTLQEGIKDAAEGRLNRVKDLGKFVDNL